MDYRLTAESGRLAAKNQPQPASPAPQPNLVSDQAALEAEPEAKTAAISDLSDLPLFAHI